MFPRSRTADARRSRRLRPFFHGLEDRVVLSSLYTFSGINGIAIDTSGRVFVSYDNSSTTGPQQQAIAEMDGGGSPINSTLFTSPGSPGALVLAGPSSAIPSVAAGDLLELLPDGELESIDPTTGAGTLVDNLSNYSADTSRAYDIQTGTTGSLSGPLSLAGATFGDFGVYGDSLVAAVQVGGEDLVVRVTYASSTGAATVLADSSTIDGLATPGGVAVDSKGTVLTTLPYQVPGTSTTIHVAVGLGITFDQGVGPSPFLPNLGLTAIPNIQSSAITVDAQDNFLLAASDSSLYGGGSGIIHINGTLSAFLADPVSRGSARPVGIAFQVVNGSNELAFSDSVSGGYTTAGELSLFSGQVTPAELRSAYGINQIALSSPGGGMIVGNGTGQTIAIVEEGIDPTLAADLATFDSYFGIPAPPGFQIVNEYGSTTQNLSIVGEASLDVEWAHAIAPGASIVVVNSAYDPYDSVISFQNLMAAMRQAAQIPGVSVVSLSYGLPESSVASMGVSQSAIDATLNVPGVTFVVAAGDSGIYASGTNQAVADYPAASPNVLAVGVTSVTIGSSGIYPGTGPTGEVAWGSGTTSGIYGGGGGGLSSVEPQPSWQAGVVPSSLDPTGARALPDVSIDSGSAQPYDVFTSTLAGSSVSSNAVGWLGDAGTSAAAPIWAGLIAIADQGRALFGASPLSGPTQTLPALYSLPSSDFHDIVNGNNGAPAGPGYDLATGLGTPVANLIVPALASYQLGGAVVIQSPPPPSVAAGVPFSLSVRVVDSSGTPVNGGTAVIALAGGPAGAVLGGNLAAPVVNGLATFSGLTLVGPAAGYALAVADAAVSGTAATVAIAIQAATSPTGPTSPTSGGLAPLAIVAEQPVYQRRFNRRGRPVGKVTLSGFTLQFQGAPSASAVSDLSNYRVEMIAIRRAGHRRVRVLRPVAILAVMVPPATDSVIVELAGAPKFPNGGQLTVGPAVLGSAATYLIARGGKQIGLG